MPEASRNEPSAKPKKRKDPRSYWEKRKDSIYLHAARVACRRFARKPQSVIDVGSNGTPTLEWHRETATRLVSVDLRKPYVAAGVESITTDFLQFEFSTRFDLVTCFQVLEHVPDPEAFAQKLLKLGKVVIISVPYQWPKGKCREHPNDPVDEIKLLTWFGREPTYSHLSKEIELDRQQRLIHVYSSSTESRQVATEKRKPRPDLVTRVKRAVGKHIRRLQKSKK